MCVWCDVVCVSVREPETDLKTLARLAEGAERYSDMVDLMRLLVQRKIEKQQDLDTEERNLLSVSFKNVVGSLRQTWYLLLYKCWMFVGLFVDLFCWFEGEL